MLRALLIEDDRDLAASVADYLELNQISVDHAYNGKAGLTLATDNQYDVLLLDLMLPRMDGLTVCQTLRQSGVDTPVLMLTARDTLDDKEAGFESGADDYLVKPFAIKELVMRARALSRRRSGEVRRLEIADLVMELDTKEVTRAGQLLKLSPSSWKLLEVLMRASPSVVSPQQLEQVLWGDDAPDSNGLRVLIFNLRKRVDKPFKTALIHTISGQGVVIRETSA